MYNTYLSVIGAGLICLSFALAAPGNLIDAENIKLPDEVDDVVELVRSKQEVCVSGRVVCEDDPEKTKKVLLKMWDIDKWNPDDVMAESRTTDEGFFKFCGKARDPMNDIEPMLKIYHKCKHTGECFRKLRLQIPANKIGGEFEFLEDIDLEPKGVSEGTKCLSKESLLEKLYSVGKKLMGIVSKLMLLAAVVR